MGPVSLQPSEFIKIGIIMVLANYYGSEMAAKENYNPAELLRPIALLFIPYRGSHCPARHGNGYDHTSYRFKHYSASGNQQKSSAENNNHSIDIRYTDLASSDQRLPEGTDIFLYRHFLRPFRDKL